MKTKLYPSRAIFAPLIGGLLVVNSGSSIAETANDQFVASVLVESTLGTCSVTAPSINFGEISESANLLLNDYATDFNLEFECSGSVDGVTVRFERGSGDASVLWRMQNPPGSIANSIDYIIDRPDGPRVYGNVRMPVELTDGTAIMPFVASITNISNAKILGTYISNVNVTIEF